MQILNARQIGDAHLAERPDRQAMQLHPVEAEGAKDRAEDHAGEAHDRVQASRPHGGDRRVRAIAEQRQRDAEHRCAQPDREQVGALDVVSGVSGSDQPEDAESADKDRRRHHLQHGETRNRNWPKITLQSATRPTCNSQPKPKPMTARPRSESGRTPPRRRTTRRASRPGTARHSPRRTAVSAVSSCSAPPPQRRASNRRRASRPATARW